MQTSAFLCITFVVVQLSHQEKWVNVHEPEEEKWNLLIFVDETTEMKSFEFKPPLYGVTTYLQSISDQTNVALASSERNFLLYWQHKSNLGDHFSALEMYLNGSMFCGTKVRDEYFDLAVNNLLDKGDIDPSYKTVVFCINSCTMIEVENLNPNKPTDVIYICAEGKSGHGTNRSDWQRIKTAIQQSSTSTKNVSVHQYTTYEQFLKFLDSQYPTKSVQVADCIFNKTCQYGTSGKTHSNGSCLAVKTAISIHRQSCEPNETTTTTICQRGDCPCDANDSTSDFIEDCIAGYQRKWSLNPTCNQTPSVQACEMRLRKDAIDKDKNKIGDIIVPVLIGILFLLIVVVIVVVIVMVRRHAKKGKGSERFQKSGKSVKSMKSSEAPKSLLPSGKSTQKNRNKKTANTLPKSSSVANPKSKKIKKPKK